ncbi:MAG TPA: TetR/AcrR family transcriptional regulator [Roseateles sp.]|nr:TetR/AcrR family transcriptional regulator [Roseateles sp.]
MQSKPSKREQTHERIVEVASRAIRRGGYGGVGVAEIMKEAGLTHGGFYAHFESRNAMLAEALAYAGRESSARVAQRVEARRAQGESALRIIIESYLGESHLNGIEQGCPVAALVSEMPRQAPELLAVSAERVRALIQRVRQALPARPAQAAAAEATAQLITSTMVGAVQLARVLGGDEGKALLAATRQRLLAQYDGGGNADDESH